MRRPDLAGPSGRLDGQRPLHLGDHVVKRFVSPQPQRSPAGIRERGVVASIPRHVAVELGSPVLRVCFGVAPVNRAAMPETTVYEYGQTRPRKDDIWPAPHPWKWLMVLAKPEAPAMKRGSQLTLHFALGSITTHNTTSTGTGRRRCIAQEFIRSYGGLWSCCDTARAQVPRRKHGGVSV
jgi:hypothetical protein